MVCFDSIKLEVSNDCLRKRKGSHYIKRVDFDYNKEPINQFEYLNEQRLGLKSVRIKQESTIIEVSAKILKEKYFDLINKNNVEEAIDKINETGLIEFDKNEFLDTALVHKADITNNLRPKTAINQIISNLSILSAGKKYKVKPYQTGISIIAKAKSNSERLILYDKYLELKKNNKSNNELKKYIEVEQFKRVLRVESNFRSYKNIRESFGIEKGERIYFKDILTSERKINYDIFCKMFDMNEIESIEEKAKIIEILKEPKLSKTYKILGQRELLKIFDDDIGIIGGYIRSKVKGNISSYIKELKEVKKLYDYVDLEIDIVDEVRRLLAA